MKFLNEDDDTNELENKWEWSEGRDDVGNKFGKRLTKSNVPGICYCVPCGSTITFKSSGKKAVTNQALDSNHKKSLHTLRTNQISLQSKCFFGICNGGKFQQTNYIFGEDQCIGLDSLQSQSANSVVSMLDHYLSNLGRKAKICCFNADNWEQNKNQVVSRYFAWRVATRAKDEIHLHCRKPYHARCSVDGMFGLARRKIRQDDCESIQDEDDCESIQDEDDCESIQDNVNCIQNSSRSNHAASPLAHKWSWRD